MSKDSVLSIKNAITVIVGQDFSNYSATDPLNLDSIHRITLVVELENIFDVIISDENLTPEVFETIESLAVYVEGLRCSNEV